VFLGHFAVGLAAKRAAPRTSLATLTLAALWLDALWPLFLLVGVERAAITPHAPDPFLTLDFESYPISHSLLMTLVWAALFTIVYAMRTRYRAGAVVAGLCVLSHWVLDWVTHVPDLPLWPGGPKAGLGLWQNATATIIVESLLFLAGLWVYVRMTRPKNLVGRAALWAYVIVLAGLYVADANAPAPPNMTVVAFSGIVGWIFVPWAFWIDHNRSLKNTV
jgi:LexA-binding, inner membrane-associated putative hydrolase